MDTIEGQLVLNITSARKALGNIGRSTIYRLIAAGKLEVARFDGRPKITARSIVKLLALAEDEEPKGRTSSSKAGDIVTDAPTRLHPRRRSIKTEAQ